MCIQIRRLFFGVYSVMTLINESFEATKKRLPHTETANESIPNQFLLQRAQYNYGICLERHCS